MLIGICGFAGSGKDSAADILQTECGIQDRVAFADALRNLAVRLNVYFPQVDMRYNDILKDEGCYEAAKRKYPCVREFLVALGHGARCCIGPNVWVDAALPRDKVLSRSTVVTDVRYANEAERIRDLGGKIWKVTRSGVGAVHATEAESLAVIKPDHIVCNDGTLEDLKLQVQALFRGDC